MSRWDEFPTRFDGVHTPPLFIPWMDFISSRAKIATLNHRLNFIKFPGVLLSGEITIIHPLRGAVSLLLGFILLVVNFQPLRTALSINLMVKIYYYLRGEDF